jgi:uncharacterized membrane protein YhiD involved in acid resistance
MAAGFGMYTLTIIATVIVVGALWILDLAENLMPRTRHRVIVIRRQWGPDCVLETVNKVKQAGMKVHTAAFERTPDLQFVDISIHTAFKRMPVYYALERALEKDEVYELMATREE